MDDPRGEHMGLSRAGPGYYQEWAGAVLDRETLLRL
jgi:hypothetical protein